jgi:hypothetical protein
VEKKNDKTDPQQQIPTEVTVPYESDKQIGHTDKGQQEITTETPVCCESREEREKRERRGSER